MVTGMGLITGSNFFTPQVNLPGSMASFVLPAAVPAHLAAANGGTAGLGQGLFAPGPGNTMFSSMNFDFTGAFLQTYWPYILGGGVLLFLLASKR